MQAAAHDKKFADKVGIPQNVARDYNREDAKRAEKAKKRYGKKK